MIDEQNFREASQRDLGRHVEERVSSGFLAFAAGSVAGALCAGAAVLLSRAFFAGDEPPIRVKGGSMHIDVLSKSAVWEPIGSTGKKWKLTGGNRGKDDYDVVVTGSVSSGNKTVTGKDVRVEYTDTDASVVRWVELKSTGNKTMIKDASDPLSLSEYDKRLSFNGNGYISKIKVDAYEFNFASKSDLEHALLMDF